MNHVHYEDGDVKLYDFVFNIEIYSEDGSTAFREEAPSDSSDDATAKMGSASVNYNQRTPKNVT